MNNSKQSQTSRQSSSQLQWDSQPLTESEVELLADLKRHPGYQVWLHRVLADRIRMAQAECNSAADFPAVLRAQGRVQELFQLWQVLHDITSKGGVIG